MKTLTAIFTAALCTSLVFGQSSLHHKKVNAMDNEKIINAIQSIFRGTDQRDWPTVENSFAERVLLDYTSLAGGNPVHVSPKEIIAAWQAVLPGFQSTHHQIGNFTINTTGNTASASHRGLALHYLPNETHNNSWVVVGSYDYELKKDNNTTWKVTSMKFNLQKQEGNLQLPALAQQKATQKARLKPGALSENNKNVVEKFFSALEKLDIEMFMSAWADDGKQFMPLSPENFPKELIGKEAIYNQYKSLPASYTSMKFPRKYFATEDPATIIVQYGGIIQLKDGGRYDNNYAGIFNIRDGKIHQFTEYFDPFILQDAFGKKLEGTFNVENKTANEKRVEFKSEGLVLAGTLHLPKGFTEQNQYKAIIVTGSWTTVKEQMPDLYADKLAGQGLIALTFDFRNYGESEGQPRNYEVPAMKVQDIINAVTYLQSLPFVNKDEIGGLAICASSGYMAEAVVKGADMKAMAFVAPWLHNGSIAKAIYGGEEGVQTRINQSIEAKKRFAETGKADFVPAVSTTDNNAAMFGNFDYYLDNNRGAVKQWDNQFAVMAWQGWLEYDPIPYASKINIPILMVHSKTAAIPQGAELFYNNVKSTKNIIWFDGPNQFDFYDQEPYTTNAAGEAVKWYQAHLN